MRVTSPRTLGMRDPMVGITDPALPIHDPMLGIDEPALGIGQADAQDRADQGSGAD